MNICPYVHNHVERALDLEQNIWILICKATYQLRGLRQRTYLSSASSTVELGRTDPCGPHIGLLQGPNAETCESADYNLEQYKCNCNE